MRFEDSQSAPLIATYFQWLLGLGVAILTVRIIYTIIQGTQNLDDNVNLGAVITKVSREIKAAVIMTVLEFVVQLMKSYFFSGG